jgi:hemolysin D
MFLKNMFKGVSKLDDKHEFKPTIVEIEEAPANPAGRTILWIIISTIFFAVLWLYIGKIDVVVSARGIVIPQGEVKELQPIDTGSINNILVKEGDIVKKGDTLIEIDPSVIETNLESKEKNLKLLELEIARLNALIEHSKFHIDETKYDAAQLVIQQDIYDTTIKAYDNEIFNNSQELKKINEQIKSLQVEKHKLMGLLEPLYHQHDSLMRVKDLVLQSQIDDLDSRMLSYEKSLLSLKHRFSELLVQRKQIKKNLSYIQNSFKNKYLTELAFKQKDASVLKAEIDAIMFKNMKQKIKSPVNGYIGKIFVHTIGGVVTPAQKLISVVPLDAPLVIKAKVLNRDIGFIKEGMEAAIKIDTFDFQKYGTIKGEVTHISNESINDEHLGPIYEIYVEPSKYSLIVENQEVQLSTGMSLTAEIKVNQRRIIDFFIYPLIKYMDEGMSVR